MHPARIALYTANCNAAINCKSKFAPTVTRLSQGMVPYYILQTERNVSTMEDHAPFKQPQSNAERLRNSRQHKLNARN